MKRRRDAARRTRRPCPNCKADASATFSTPDRNRRLSRATFCYYGCPSCGLIFLATAPDGIEEFYPPAYYGKAPSLEVFADAAVGAEGYKLELVRRFVDRGRLMDVGPALGGFAYLAKQAGFAVEAIEMDAACCAYLSDTLGIRAFCTADVADTLRREGPYDVISLWHVIEHLADPSDALEAAASALGPEGIIVLAAPNPDALQFRLLRGRWTHVDAPRHLYLIPCSLIEERAAGLGLKVLMTTTTDEGGLGWNLFGWRESLANLAVRPSLRANLKRLGTVVDTLAAPLERVGLRGSTYTMVLGREWDR